MNAPAPTPVTGASLLLRNADLLFSFALFGILVLMVVPVPPFILDFLLALSIAGALLMLMVVVYVKDPPEFAVFPTILLAITLYRLGLNVASTRLILVDGYAGNIIHSFGTFVTKGNFVVGVVVFLILIVINFIVITKGAGRIAEVAARFTLDALPGKQMAIDAELNAGLIDEQTAMRRRVKVQKEAEFYGSMDGASKFVRGDAIAGILITVVNVVGGISIGVLQKGLSISDAVQKFVILSIGDGLVSQVPALFISVAAGLLTTRSSGTNNLGWNVSRQFLTHPRAMGVVGVMMLIFALLPGMPMLPFLSLAGAAFFLVNFMKKHGLATEHGVTDDAWEPLAEGAPAAGKGAAAASAGPALPTTPTPGSNADLAKLIQVDTFTIELGFGLVALTERAKGGDLLDRVTGVRRNTATQLGLMVPPISVRDNIEMETNEYRFLVRQKEVARGTLMPNRLLAMNATGASAPLKGVPTVEPVFGLDAFWIAEEERKTAEMNGYTVVDATSVLITHLAEVLKDHAWLLLEREDVQKLVDLVKEKNPTLVSELLPDLVSVGVIQGVCRNLLKERVPIRHLTVILESIADFAPATKSPDELTEQVRRRLGLYFVPDYECAPGTIKSLTLDPRLEQALIQRVRKTATEVGLMMDPNLTQHLLAELGPRVREMTEEGLVPLITLSSDLRLAFKRFFEPSYPRLVVLSYQELPNQIQVQNHGIISAPVPAVAMAG